ncbi:hypothetical protein HA49_01690 [Tatumella morbirosei]|uniref:Serine protease n=2 Tax=Tatumella morbirosei TaxID=642227 RepID=A0A095VYA7_9GAMM|nr:hypothetical protein HA49_01690 [Tatumella morbirosei]
MEPVFLENANEDVAILKVENYEFIPPIKLSFTHDIYQSEDSLLLSEVLCIGYPPIPITVYPFQVAVNSTISSLIIMRGSKYLSYVLATMARGGFSGGPIINDKGRAIALVTDSLCLNDQALETGFMACISISSAVELACNHGWDPDANDFYPNIESLAIIKLALKNTAKLNPHAFDFILTVYDDDRDVCIEFNCSNENIIDLAVQYFNSICPIHSNIHEKGYLLATPVSISPSWLLKKAAKEAKDGVIKEYDYILVRERFTDGWS